MEVVHFLLENPNIQNKKTDKAGIPLLFKALRNARNKKGALKDQISTLGQLLLDQLDEKIINQEYYEGKQP